MKLIQNLGAHFVLNPYQKPAIVICKKAKKVIAKLLLKYSSLYIEVLQLAIKGGSRIGAPQFWKGWVPLGSDSQSWLTKKDDPGNQYVLVGIHNVRVQYPAKS